MPKIVTPKNFLCPITHKLIAYPVLALDGNVYERTAIEKWLEQNGISPVTHLKFTSKELLEYELFWEQLKKFKNQNNVCGEEDFVTAVKKAMRHKDLKIIEDLNYLDVYLNYLSKNFMPHYLLAPLHYAASQNKPEIIHYLLDNGADINIKSNFEKDVENEADYWTPLSWSFPRHWRTFDCLLERGANPNIIDKDGCTLLHHAVKETNYGLTQSLLRAGVDINLRNKEGKTALDVVKEYGRHEDEIIVLLSEYSNYRQILRTACQMLVASRTLFHVKDPGDFRQIPRDIKHYILVQVDNQKYLDSKQIKQIIDYAADKKTLGQSKMQFSLEISQEIIFFKTAKRSRNKESFEEADGSKDLSTKLELKWRRN